MPVGLECSSGRPSNHLSRRPTALAAKNVQGRGGLAHLAWPCQDLTAFRLSLVFCCFCCWSTGNAVRCAAWHNPHAHFECRSVALCSRGVEALEGACLLMRPMFEWSVMWRPWLWMGNGSCLPTADKIHVKCVGSSPSARAAATAAA